MFCSFLDFHHIRPRDIANVTEQDINRVKPRDSIALLTCHRVELYSMSEIRRSSHLISKDEKWVDIEGANLVMQRLALLSIGANSLILGELFIREQINRAFNRTTVHNFPFSSLDQALVKAQKIQSKFGFITQFNYDEAAFHILQKASNQRNIVVFGGGMLGKSVITNDKFHKYDKAIVVTKNANKLQTEIRELDSSQLHPNVQVMSASEFNLPLASDIILATTNRSELYRKQVIEALNVSDVGSVVDLSAIPFSDFGDITSRYTNMYDDFFLSLVSKANRALLGLFPRVVNTVESCFNQLEQDISTEAVDGAEQSNY